MDVRNAPPVSDPIRKGLPLCVCLFFPGLLCNPQDPCLGYDRIRSPLNRGFARGNIDQPIQTAQVLIHPCLDCAVETSQPFKPDLACHSAVGQICIVVHIPADVIEAQTRNYLRANLVLHFPPNTLPKQTPFPPPPPTDSAWVLRHWAPSRTSSCSEPRHISCGLSGSHGCPKMWLGFRILGCPLSDPPEKCVFCPKVLVVSEYVQLNAPKRATSKKDRETASDG